MTQPSSRTRKLETDWFEVKFYQLENGEWGVDFRAGTLPSQLQAFKDYQAEVADRYARSQQVSVLKEVRGILEEKRAGSATVYSKHFRTEAQAYKDKVLEILSAKIADLEQESGK